MYKFMNKEKITTHSKQLSSDITDNCLEIIEWISQFPIEQQSIAKKLLLNLDFISRDQYSYWLKNTINDLVVDKKHAIYSVRKLDRICPLIWHDGGELVNRTGQSQGSEDLVYSVIASLIKEDFNIKKRTQDKLFDHPSINILRKEKINKIILVDDSIGSGRRVSFFIKQMFKNKSFVSWWNYGIIKIYVVSFSRQKEAEKHIINSSYGTDSPKRKFPRSSKFKFISEKVYSVSGLENRWGKDYQEIYSLCTKKTFISKNYRKGYGGVMANLIFYHSVPNNIPGMVWFNSDKWKALFPNRVLPNWIIPLIEGNNVSENSFNISSDLIELLTLIKKRVTNKSSLSFRMNRDVNYVNVVIDQAISSGFITNKNRLTKAGYELISHKKNTINLENQDRSLYIPRSWCVG